MQWEGCAQLPLNMSEMNWVTQISTRQQCNVAAAQRIPSDPRKCIFFSIKPGTLGMQDLPLRHVRVEHLNSAFSGSPWLIRSPCHLKENE